MRSDKFAALISGYCRQAGIDAAATVLQGAPLDVDGVLFALAHDPRAAPDLAHVYCDLGQMPDDRKEETCRQLLELNMTLHPITGHALMISPHTGHMLLAASLTLQGATVKKLDDMLHAMTNLAQNWRKNLAESSRPAAASASMAGGQAARRRIMRGIE